MRGRNESQVTQGRAEHEVAAKFLAEVVGMARGADLMSDEPCPSPPVGERGG
jgi:hypothetical protein